MNARVKLVRPSCIPSQFFFARNTNKWALSNQLTAARVSPSPGGEGRGEGEQNHKTKPFWTGFLALNNVAAMILLVILAMLVGLALFLFVGWKSLTFFEQLIKGIPAPPPVISNADQKTDSIQAPPLSNKVIPVTIAWLIGAFIYFASVFDGFESLIFQPIIAAVVSGICVSMQFGIGLRVCHLWENSGHPHGSGLGVSVQ